LAPKTPTSLTSSAGFGVIVVDDHTLFAVLAKQAAPDLQHQVDAEQVFTTSSWYYRLARAVGDRTFAGALSRRIQALPSERRRGVEADLEELPTQIGLLPPRVVVPVMAKLSSQIRRLNHLNADALASAMVLEGGIRVVVASDILQAASSRLGIPLEVAAV